MALRSCHGVAGARSAEAEEQELMAGDLESGKGSQVPQGLFETAGVHLCCAAATLTLEVMVVVAGVAAHEAHHLVRPQDALSPTLPHEPLQIAVDGGKAGPALRYALPDLFHGQRAI